MSAIALVTNPAARAGGARHDVVRALGALRSLGAEPVEVATGSPTDTLARIEALVADGVERVVVLGGDGMVHLAVQALARTEVALGVIPSGTGNDFATALGVPGGIDDAAARALGPTRRIDLIAITGPDGGVTWAATIATIGFAADVNERANAMTWPRGASRYTIATVAQLPRLHSRVVGLDIDGTPHHLEATLVAIANTTSFGGGMHIAPLAAPDDGVLDLTVVGPVGRRRLLRFFRRVFDGTHLELDEVRRLTGSTIDLTCPGARLWADGEPVGGTLDHRPITLTAAPLCLLVAAGS
jgi:diacylglycerol kinase (ATP)